MVRESILKFFVLFAALLTTIVTAGGCVPAPPQQSTPPATPPVYSEIPPIVPPPTHEEPAPPIAGSRGTPLAVISPVPVPSFSAPRIPDAPEAPIVFPEVLIYAGTGTWTAEASALWSILSLQEVRTHVTDAAEINGFTQEKLASYGLIIFPGGDSQTITDALTPATRFNLREAVRKKAVSYLGFCAGAWIAASPETTPEGEASYGLGILNLPVQQPTYMGIQGLHYTMARTRFPNRPSRELLWYGGPVTASAGSGSIIAKYSDGTAAISQLWAEKGFVILAGVHPAATPTIIDSLGLTNTDGADYELAWELLKAGLLKKPLPGFP